VVERAAVAQRIRSESQGRKAAQPDLSQWPDVDADEARRWLNDTNARTLVHGHTHRPGVVDLGEGLERRVLTDWDFDGTPRRGHVLRLDDQGWTTGATLTPP
jgi:UDP-2,3-diacylglucosamine hydrolase